MTHPDECPCFGCKARSVSFSPTSRGSTSAADTVARDRRWEADHAAYRRLRDDGMQPQRIDGSANLETHASDRFEVATGRLFKTDAERKHAREGIERARQLDLKIPGDAQ